MSQITDYMSDLVLKPTKTPNGINVGFGFVTFFNSLRIRFTIVKSRSSVLFVSWPKQSYVKDDKTEYMDHIIFTDDTYRKAANDFIVKEFNKLIGISKTEKKENEPMVSFGGFGAFSGNKTETNNEEDGVEDPFEPTSDEAKEEIQNQVEKANKEQPPVKKQLVKWK